MKGDKNNVPESAKRGSFHRIMKALSPLPYLGKAQDYYVRSLNKLAAKANHSGLVATVPPITTLPKSFTTTSSRKDDEYGELVRAASQRRSLSSSSSSSSGLYRLGSAEQALARSRSAAPSVGTIYEDEPCYFPPTLPKSVSVAASRYPRSSTPYNFHPQSRIAV